MPPTKNKQQNVTKNPTQKFNETHARNIEVAKKLVENYVSSSEDEDELDEKTILKSLYQHYNSRKEDEHILARTACFLENVLQTGAATCLICIGSIKRSNPIWSCKYCYCFFHLNCIKRWANDSMAQAKAQTKNEQGYYNHMGEYVPPKKLKALNWCCPQCRREFQPEERPTDYECFCGKEINPSSQPWLVPHSCGEICGKALQPNCGHKCTLLCHPGPCPPCAQYASVSCKCGKSPPKSVRCAEKLWECHNKCELLLPCKEHVCKKFCHKPGQCPPCQQTSMQPCECGMETAKRQCCELKWHCNKPCGKLYTCALHTCKKICHSGECGDCPLSLPRSCPCGKTKKVGPCSELIDTCGDTCQKVLACGLHTCTQRCHKGHCNLNYLNLRKMSDEQNQILNQNRGEVVAVNDQEQEASRPPGSGSVLCYLKNKILYVKSVSTTIPFSYPSEFFAEPKKPIAHIRYKTNTLVELENAVYGGLDKCTLQVGVANAYLYKVLKGVSAQNQGVWTSYGVRIAGDGEDICPFAMIEVIEADGGVLGDIAPCPADLRSSLMFTICTLYRLIHAENEDYRNIIISNMKNQPEGLKATEKFQMEILVSDFNGWTSDKNYNTLMAAIDMFYHKFPAADYANLRFGTVTSRFRDCAALTSFQRAMTYFGIDHPFDLMQWIFTTSVARDVHRLFNKDEELDTLNSYFPYQMEFKLVTRSAYSATTNQNLYYWTNAICAIQGDIRGKNTRFLLKSDVIRTRCNALAVGYILSSMARGHTAGSRDEPRMDNPVGWYDHLAGNQYNWSNKMKKFFKAKARSLHDCRKGTIGHHLYTEMTAFDDDDEN